MDPKEIASRVAAALQAIEVPLSRVGHFGTSIHQPDAKDIDILVTLRTPSRASLHHYETTMSAIAERVAGNFSRPPPSDPNMTTDTDLIVDAARRCISIPVVAGFGPANVHQHESTWVHLNGPVTDACWDAFGAAFPIHAWIIRNNFTPIVGTLPTAGAIRGHDVLRYAHQMERRLKTKPSYDYFTKLIKTLGLLAGERSCITETCIRRIFRVTDPLRNAIDSIQPDAPDSWLQLVPNLLRQIRHEADAMIRDGTVFPEAWKDE